MKYLAILIFLMAIPVHVFAQEPVVDVAAQTHRAENWPKQWLEMTNQTAKLRDNLAVAKDELKNMKEVKNYMAQVREDFATVYNQTFGLVGEVVRLKEDLANTPQEMKEHFEGLMSDFKCYFKDLSNYKKAERMMQAEYTFFRQQDERGRVYYTDSDGNWVERFEGPHVSAGGTDPLHLSDKCNVYMTHYDRILSTFLQTKAEEKRVRADQLAYEKEGKAFVKELEELEKVATTADSLKEVNATLLKVQMLSLRQMQRMERNLNGLYMSHLKKDFAEVGNKLKNTPKVDRESYRKWVDSPYDRRNSYYYKKAAEARRLEDEGKLAVPLPKMFR